MSRNSRFGLATVQLATALLLLVAPLVVLWIVGASIPEEKYWRVFFITVLAMVAVIPAVLVLVRRNLVQPLAILSSRAKGFADGAPILVKERFTVKEIDNLARSMNDMIEAVLSREESLRELNETLESRVRERTQAHEQTIGNLEATKDQLLLSEKMASLGTLVTGVTHEINAPLSIGVTAASFLHERTRSMISEWDKQSLTQDDFERFLEDAAESSRIIQSNLEQTTRILGSLKQVAVDQETDERREMELGAYLRDIVLSLKHHLRAGRHTIAANTTGLILVNTYPGALIQIFNNLVYNSVIHGFGDNEECYIDIAARKEGETVIIEYSDNGRGLSGEEAGRIFDRFFTTKREKGSTGLGMSIVRNLVIDRLNGSIEITPPPNGGAGFTIRFPRNPKEEN